MRDGGGGDIVNVASVAGRTARIGLAAYNMTKWGVVGFSEALRQEGQHIGIIEPGYVDTELQGHNRNPMIVERLEQARERIGKVLEADDIARAVLYVVSQPQHVSVTR
jgi:clavulanate-9-aldehyde reducatase